MFTLSREIEPDRLESILDAVDGQLTLHAASKEEFEGQVVYRIPFFAPKIRYSMFAPFSEVSVKSRATGLALVLRPVSPWIPLVFGLAASILFGLSGIVDAWSIALPLGGPMLLYLIWLADGLSKTSRWWSRL